MEFGIWNEIKGNMDIQVISKLEYFTNTQTERAKCNREMTPHKKVIQTACEEYAVKRQER